MYFHAQVDLTIANQTLSEFSLDILIQTKIWLCCWEEESLSVWTHVTRNSSLLAAKKGGKQSGSIATFYHKGPTRETGLDKEYSVQTAQIPPAVASLFFPKYR